MEICRSSNYKTKYFQKQLLNRRLRERWEKRVRERERDQG